LNGNKNIFIEQQLYAIKIADLYNPEIRNRLMKLSEKRQFTPVLPAPESVYNKNIVKENDPIYQKSKIAKKKYFEDNSAEKLKLKTLNSSNKENYILKLNNAINNLNDNNKKTRYSQNFQETTSTSSKEDLQYPNSGNEDKLNSPTENKKIGIKLNSESEKNLYANNFTLFSSRPSSRFDFVKSSTNYENVEIPQFILHLIFKKSATHKLSKNMSHIEDILYSDKLLEAEYKNKNPWAQFIIDNKSETIHDKKHNTENYDRELIDEFDQINSFIFNNKNLKKLLNL
jgi:hypothetical protein